MPGWIISTVLPIPGSKPRPHPTAIESLVQEPKIPVFHKIRGGAA